MMQYRLTRTTPRGDVRAWPDTFKRTRDAVTAACYCLLDNGAASKRDANGFGAKLHDAPLGTSVKHEPSGYAFRIDKAA